MTRAQAAAAAVVLLLAACAGPTDGGGLSADSRSCVNVDEPYYATSAELEAAADAIAVGTITAVSPDDEYSWVVTFTTRAASGPAAGRAVGDLTVHVPLLCGHEPYGETFRVGGEFVMLLSGPVDGAFFPVNTTQGLLPVIDGAGVPLEGADDPPSLTLATAARLGVRQTPPR